MRGTALGTRPIVLHPPNWFFTTGANQSLSKSIGTYQRKADTFRLVQINSDKLRRPMSNNRSAPFRSPSLHIRFFTRLSTTETH